MGAGYEYAMGWLGALIILYICLWILKKPIKYLLKFISRAIICSFLIIVLNYIFKYFSFSLFVGINTATAVIVGILGLPGIILLYILDFIL